MKGIKFWTKDGFDVATCKWRLHERVNQKFNGSGSDQSGTCWYTYNELGYRGDSIYKDGFRIMSIGDSHTEGVGVNDEETWSHQLCKLIPGAVDLNFGFGGRSNDYIFRCLQTYFKTARPQLVNIMYTYPSRKEYYTGTGDLEPFHVNPWGYFLEDDLGKKEHAGFLEITQDENDLINWYKNHLLITYFCKLNNVPMVWNGSFLNDTTIKEENRFDGDYDNFIDKSADIKHAGAEHNKKYAKKLYNFLKQNDVI
jgi:hypothetical protein